MTHSVSVLNETLIVATQTDEEQYRSHVLEKVDPFPPFRFLTAHVDEDHVVSLDHELRLGHAGRGHPTVDDVVVRGDVLRVP